MRVAAQLGLDNPQTSTLLALAREEWPTWQVGDHRLSVCSDPLDLPEIFTGWTPAQRDQVLQALAHLASPDGGGQIAAAGLLAWLLIPGAAKLASLLNHLSHRIDEVVAAQLWIEVRSWNGGHKVAANTLMNLRRGVLQDLGIKDDDPTWEATWLWADRTDGADAAAQVPDHESDRPSEEVLAEVLIEAREHDLVTAEQCELLLQLAHAADAHDIRVLRRGSAGLLAEQVLVSVGQGLGMHRSSVRRHAARSLDRLRAHARSTGFVATA